MSSPAFLRRAVGSAIPTTSSKNTDARDGFIIRDNAFALRASEQLGNRGDGVFLFFHADELDKLVGQNSGVGYFLPWLILECLDSSCSVSFHPTVKTALGNSPSLTEHVSEM